MGSNSVLELPSIDFSKLGDSKLGSRSWDSVQNAVWPALEEYGCFDALYDKVTMELHDAVFKEMEEMFNLPAETKRRFVDPTRPHDGYLANLHEAMGVYDALNSGGIERLADFLWPEGNTKFCELLNTYLRRLSELDYLIKKMVFRSFGVEHYLDAHAESTIYSVRLLKCGAPKTEEAQAGGITHYDMNFVTMLQQNHGWSNGRLYCPRHHVMMSGHEARHSIGIFSGVEGTIRCPEELVDKNHPLLFKPFDIDGLVRIYATPEGPNGVSALKTFYNAFN